MSVALAALLVMAAVGPGTPDPEAQVRALIERQQRAWNAADTAAYFAAFTPDAVFTDQARTGETLTPYGSATLAQARTQTRRFLATSKSFETGQVRAVRVTGQRAQAVSAVMGRITSRGATRTVCLERKHDLIRRNGGWRITARTDTLFRCPRAR